MKVVKAKDLKVGDELIRYSQRGWYVVDVTDIGVSVNITLKYGSSVYTVIKLSKNYEVEVIAKKEKE